MRFPCLSIAGDLLTSGLDFHLGLTRSQNELKDPREVGSCNSIPRLFQLFLLSSDACDIGLWPSSRLSCFLIPERAIWLVYKNSLEG